MKISPRPLLGALCCLIASACSGLTPSFQWAQQIGGASPNSIQQMVLDADGNRFLVGRFDSRLTVGGAVLTVEGTQDLFVAKLDPKGQVLWLRQASSTSVIPFFWPIEATAAAVDSSGNLIVAGVFNAQARFGSTVLNARAGNDLFLVKYDGAGNLLWARQAGGASRLENRPSSLFIDENNNSFLAGTLGKGTTLFGGGPGGGPATPVTVTMDYDMFAARYDNSGALVWAWSGLSTKGPGVGGQISGSTAGATVVGAVDGKPYVVFCDGATGNPWFPLPYFYTSATAGGDLSARIDDASGSTVSFYVAGGDVLVGTNSLNLDSGNYGIARFVNNNVLWVRQFTNDTRIVAGPNGALYGFIQDGGTLLRLDPQTGRTVWSVSFEGSLASVLPNVDGSVLLAGRFPGPTEVPLLRGFLMSRSLIGSSEPPAPK